MVHKVIRKIIMKKKIGLISLLMAGTTAVALTGCSNNDAQVKQIEEDVASTKKQVKTLQDSLTEAQTSLSQYMTKINTILKIDEVEANGNAIASLEKAIQNLEKSSKDLLDGEVAKIDGKITEKETALKADIKAVDDAVKALDATYATDEDVAAKIKVVQDALDALDATYATDADVDAKIKAVDESVKELDAAIKALDSTYATDADVTAKIEALANTYATITALNEAKADLQGKIDALDTTIKALDSTYATDAELDAKIKEVQDQIDALDSTYATDAALEEVKTNYATLAKLTEVQNKLMTDLVSVETYNAQIKELKDFIGKVEVDDQGKVIASVVDQIKALEDAKATVAKLNELAETVSGNKTELEAKIADLQAQIGAVEKEDGEVVKSLQAQIDELNEKVGSVISVDGKILSLQAQIDKLKAQIGDFSGSDELKDKKADLIYNLSLQYAYFQDEIEDAQADLSQYEDNVGAAYIKALFEDISRSFSHEMTGYLYKGIAYITLAGDEKEATEKGEEYATKIANYINPARFQIMQQYYLAVITDTTSEEALKELGDITDTNSYRYKYSEQVKTVKWFTDEINPDTGKEYTDEDLELLDPTAYRTMTNDKIATMKLAADKAISVNSLLTKYNSAVAEINTTFAVPATADAYPSIYKDFEKSAAYDTLLLNANDGFKGLLDEIKANITKYDACTNAKIQNLDPFTGGKSEKADITDLADQLENDTLLINFVLNEATAYKSVIINHLVATKDYSAEATYNGIKSTYKNLTAEERATIADELKAVVKLVNYATLSVKVDETTNRPRTEEDLALQINEDLNKIALIKEQANAYNTARGTANDAIDYITHDDLDDTKDTRLSFLYKLKVTEESYAITDLISKITAVPTLSEYLAAPETVEESDTTTLTIAKLLKADQDAIELLKNQGIAFNETLAYADTKTTALKATANYKSIENKDDANETTELEDIVSLINEVPLYTNYVENAKYNTNKAADKDAIDLVMYKADAYNAVLQLAEKKIKGLIDAESQVVVVGVNNLGNITTDEKNSIVAKINAVAKYVNYFGTVKVDEETTRLLTKDEIDTQKAADEAAINLLYAQAEAYNYVTGYAKSANIKENKINYNKITGVQDDGITPTTENVTINVLYIGETEQTTINTLINGVPVFENYIEKLKANEITTKVAADRTAVDNYVKAIDEYNRILGYINDNTNGKATYVNTTLAADDGELKAERTTIVNAMVGTAEKPGIAVYNNYFGAVKVDETTTRQLTAAEIEAQYTKDKAAVDLLVARAEVFKAIYEAVNAPDATNGLVAYINGLSSGYTVPDGKPADKGQFTATLKENFINQFKDLAVATEYDAVVAGTEKPFTTIAEFTTYKNSIIGVKATETTPAVVGKLELIKKSATVFKDILYYVNTNEDNINDTNKFSQFAGDYADYAKAFTDNFTGLQVYDNYMKAIAAFKTEDEFDTYYNTNVKGFIDGVVKVATYENKLIDNVNIVKTAIVTARAENAVPKITEPVAEYLRSVVNYIYKGNEDFAGYTSVTKKDDKYTTLTTITDDEIKTPLAYLKAVKDAITTLYNVDVAAANLESKLNQYVESQKNDFFDNYYKYRDDVNGVPNETGDESGEYGGYNQAALIAWLAYVPEIQQYRQSVIKYTYTTPSTNTYEAFTLFMDEIAKPENIALRYDTFVIWYSEDSDAHPKQGKVYSIIARYQVEDANKVDGARTFFKTKLDEQYALYYNAIENDDYKSEIKSNYNIGVNGINTTYAVSTASIISAYENAVKQFVETYRNVKKANLKTVYQTYTTNVSNEYYEGYSNIVEATSKDEIDSAYNTAVAAMELKDYRNKATTALDNYYGALTNLTADQQTAAATAYNTGLGNISKAADKGAIDTALTEAKAAIDAAIAN